MKDPGTPPVSPPAAVYETERLVLKVLDGGAAPLLADFFSRNRSFLEKWEPAREAEFYTRAGQERCLAADLEEFRQGRLLRLWIFKNGQEDRVIGSVAFNHIVRGAFLSCYLGYRLDAAETGRGYAAEAINRGVALMFGEYGLHRIEANVMPGNVPSLRVLEKLGFRSEGLARRYLKINGRWQDHLHMVLLSDEA